MEVLTQITDEELQQAYRSAHLSVQSAEASSLKDLLAMEMLEGELERRGFQVFPDVSFVKA